MTKLALALTAALLLSGTAHAADADNSGSIGDAFAAGNFYASVFGGAAMIDEFAFDSTMGGSGSVTFDPGFGLDAALGYDFGNGLSLEGQIGFVSAALADGSYDGNPLLAEGTAGITYGMINAWYGVDLGGVTPFIGAGVGAALVSLDSIFTGFPDSAIEDSEPTWAVQVGAGVAIALTDDISLTARYRHLQTGEVSLTDAAGDDNTGSASVGIADIGLKIAF
jgi:opacity protein-like surface antigen